MVIILSLLMNWNFIADSEWVHLICCCEYLVLFFFIYGYIVFIWLIRISSFKMLVWKFTCILHIIFLLVFIHNRNPSCNLKPQNWEFTLTSTSYNALVVSNFTDSNKTFLRWRKSSTNCWKNKVNKSRTSGRWHISSQWFSGSVSSRMDRKWIVRPCLTWTWRNISAKRRKESDLQWLRRHLLWISLRWACIVQKTPKTFLSFIDLLNLLVNMLFKSLIFICHSVFLQFSYKYCWDRSWPLIIYCI